MIRNKISEIIKNTLGGCGVVVLLSAIGFYSAKMYSDAIFYILLALVCFYFSGWRFTK